MTETKSRLAFRRAALDKLRTAYLALLDGGVKSYKIDDRELTKLDLDKLYNEITAMERQVDELEAVLNGGAGRKAFGVIIRDNW
jgi:hypothetical protein